MGDDLPTEYDCIVIGTGMTESIIAAAASRIGKRVLHLDSNEYYGGLWASFNFDGLQNWLGDCQNLPKDLENKDENFSIDLLKEGESYTKAGNQFCSIYNVKEDWYISEGLAGSLQQLSLSKKTQTEPVSAGQSGDSQSHNDSEKHARDITETEKPDSSDEKDVLPSTKSKYWTQSMVKAEQRKFNLDLAPKLLFARGSLVELLISSNIARYAEFRSVTRVLTWLGGQLESVPCSRADVFSTRHVSVVEKRMLMKLLTVCMDSENNASEFEGFEEKTFLDFLKSKKLTPNLIHYVLYAISMSSDNTPCLEGVARTRRFLNSLGRYGNTPFLWPMYGSGEIPQCFCRLCAVFGGLYHLKRSAEALIVGPGEDSQQKCFGIISGNQRIEAEHVILGVGYAPQQFLKDTPAVGLSRGIFIIDQSILKSEKETLTLLQFPSVDGVSEPVSVIELGPSTNACPQGLYVLHMTCKQRDDAKADLESVVKLLLNNEQYVDENQVTPTGNQATQTGLGDGDRPGPSDLEKCDESEKPKELISKPQILWSVYFNCPDTSECDLSANVPVNTFLCSGPDLDLDFEYAVKQAKDVFSKIYPESEFLPRAPDPEDIVLEGEETTPGPSFQGGNETLEEPKQHADLLEALEKEFEANIEQENTENASQEE